MHCSQNSSRKSTLAMPMSRRGVLKAGSAVIGSVGFGLHSTRVQASDAWPSKPVRIIVPLGAGSASDIHARMVAEELQTVYKQPFIVENKPGASGFLGAEFVARAAPDGYTLLETSNTVSSINPFLFKKLPYHPTKDFTPIARLSFMPFVFLVNTELPVKNVQDLIAYAKAAKKHISYGYANATGQVAGAALVSKSGIDCVTVPYKGTPAAMSDLMGGQITFMTGDLASAKSLIEAKKVRPIAVFTKQRSALAPELPSVAESIGAADFDLPTWLGVLGPAGIPAPIVQSLNTRINVFLGRKEIAERLAALGAEVAPATPQELGSFMEQQLEVWKVKVRDAGITPE